MAEENSCSLLVMQATGLPNANIDGRRGLTLGESGSIIRAKRILSLEHQKWTKREKAGRSGFLANRMS